MGWFSSSISCAEAGKRLANNCIVMLKPYTNKDSLDISELLALAIIAHRLEIFNSRLTQEQISSVVRYFDANIGEDFDLSKWGELFDNRADIYVSLFNRHLSAIRQGNNRLFANELMRLFEQYNSGYDDSPTSPTVLHNYGDLNRPGEIAVIIFTSSFSDTVEQLKNWKIS